jgi:hypothetical protein
MSAIVLDMSMALDGFIAAGEVFAEVTATGAQRPPNRATEPITSSPTGPTQTGSHPWPL